MARHYRRELQTAKISYLQKFTRARCTMICASCRVLWVTRLAPIASALPAIILFKMA